MSSQILKVCIELALKAGNEILNIYKTDFNFVMKKDRSPLTVADRRSNEVIVAGIKANFPHFAILSEESRDDKSRLNNDYCFIVDPLDGTKEFINRNGQFTVNIALSHKQKAVMGIVYVPATGDLYYASKGDGAFLEQSGPAESVPERLRLQVTDKVENLIMVGSKSHSSEKEARLIEEKKSKIKEILLAGSSLKGCMVASGKADLYYRFGLTSEWDTAAMQCIVEEAGGIFRQMDGTEMLYNRENNLNEKGFYVVNKRDNIWV